LFWTEGQTAEAQVVGVQLRARRASRALRPSPSYLTGFGSPVNAPCMQRQIEHCLADGEAHRDCRQAPPAGGRGDPPRFAPMTPSSWRNHAARQALNLGGYA
jgi:hypothetical protein